MSGVLLGRRSSAVLDLPSRIESQKAHINRLADENALLSNTVESLRSDIDEMCITPISHPPTPIGQKYPSARVEKPYTASVPEAPSANNIDISEIGMSIVDDYGDGSKYVGVAFKAKLKNNNTSAARIKATFVVTSEDGYELDANQVSGAVRLNPGDSEVVTTKTMLSKAVYGRIDSVVAKIKLE
jgi:hypothetical protein